MSAPPSLASDAGIQGASAERRVVIGPLDLSGDRPAERGRGASTGSAAVDRPPIATSIALEKTQLVGAAIAAPVEAVLGDLRESGRRDRALRALATG
jgi:hypothetical protein